MSRRKSDYATKLLDPRWQKLRLKVFERDEFKCRDCERDDETLHVHHCWYEKGDPWETPMEYLLSLCHSCHKRRQNWENECKRNLGLLLSGLSNISPDEGLCRLARSLRIHSLEGDPDGPILVCQADWDHGTDIRWYQYACDHPEFRPAYEAVTGTKPDWS